MKEKIIRNRRLGTVTDFQLTRKRKWASIALGFILLEGLGGQLIGPLLPAIRTEFALSASLGGVTGTVNTVSFVVAVMLTGAALGFIRPKRGVIVGLSSITLALGVMAVAPLFIVFILGLVLRSVGTGVVRGIDKPMLGHLFPNRRERFLNVYELTWAFGAAGAPLLATVVTTYATWEAAYVLVFLLTVPLVALAVLTPLPVDEISETPLTREGIRRLSSDSRIIGMTVALFLSGSLEGGLFIWMPTYLREFVSPTLANLAFSIYFLTYIPARVLHTLFASRVGALRLLVVSGVGAAGLLTYAFSLGSGHSVVIALSVAGFFVAGLFPLLSAYGIASMPENSGPVNGISLGASFAGGSLSPILLGVLIDEFSLEVGVNLLSGYAIVFAVVVSVMLLHERGQSAIPQ